MSDTTRYRLHRSFTFWTGVVLLLGFSFAWWYSWRDVMALRYGPMTVMHASGGLIVTKNPAEEKALDFRRTPPSEFVQDIRWSLFQKPYSLAGQDLRPSGLKVQPRTLEQWHRGWIAAYPKDVSLTFVPDWLMAVVLLLPWAGVIAWRIRRGVEAEPVAWLAEERRAATASAAPRATAPPDVPRITAVETWTGRMNWANLVPRKVAVIPGSPWAYSGNAPLTDTPMPLRREG